MKVLLIVVVAIIVVAGATVAILGSMDISPPAGQVEQTIPADKLPR